MINYVSDQYVKTYITIKNDKFEVMAFCSLCTLSLGAVGQLMTALALIQFTVSNCILCTLGAAGGQLMIALAINTVLLISWELIARIRFES